MLERAGAAPVLPGFSFAGKTTQSKSFCHHFLKFTSQRYTKLTRHKHVAPRNTSDFYFSDIFQGVFLAWRMNSVGVRPVWVLNMLEKWVRDL